MHRDVRATWCDGAVQALMGVEQRNRCGAQLNGIRTDSIKSVRAGRSGGAALRRGARNSAEMSGSERK